MKAYLITRPHVHHAWYNKFVGCLVPAVFGWPAQDDETWGREVEFPNCANIIHPGDCELVEVEDATRMHVPWTPPPERKPTAQEVVAPLLKALNDRITSS